MKLFRGDKITNSTEPGRYRFDGIRSKSFGKGSPRNINAEILLTSIRQHIDPVDSVDRAIYNATEFLSFSTSKDQALFWLSDKNNVTLIPEFEEYQETRYLFELNIDENKFVSIDAESTMFKYLFSCDYDLKEYNSMSNHDKLVFSATSSGTYFKSCEICRNKTMNGHGLVLIDAVKYLNVYKNSSAFDGAIEFAKEDEEWLLLPIDLLPDMSATAIPRADFWSVEHFTCAEDIAEPLKHQILGMAYDIDGNVI